MSHHHSPHPKPDSSPGGYHKAASVDELTERNVQLVAALDNAAKQKRTPTDCAVDAITAFCGRITFVWLHALLFAAWVVLNTQHAAPHLRFDPYPFQFLTLAVSLEAIFLSAFILISQNRQARLADRRNHLDLQINLLSEQENTKILSMLDAIQRKLGVRDTDPDVAILEESTRPDHLFQQIEEMIDAEEHPRRTHPQDGNTHAAP